MRGTGREETELTSTQDHREPSTPLIDGPIDVPTLICARARVVQFGEVQGSQCLGPKLGDNLPYLAER